MKARFVLAAPYSLAVVDIDHFKNFNDTYGHDTGDQVLRMVASKLGEVTGGGKAFRTGGEEFCILFSGKSVAQALPHLEALRKEVETAIFHLRSAPVAVLPPKTIAASRPRKVLLDRAPRLPEAANSRSRLVLASPKPEPQRNSRSKCCALPTKPSIEPNKLEEIV